MKYIYKPISFYLYTLLGTWAAWFVAAYLSYQQNTAKWVLELLILGLFFPAIISFYLIYGTKNQDFIKHFKNKFRINKMKKNYLLVILFLLPGLSVLSVIIPLLLKQSNLSNLTHLFNFSNETTILPQLFNNMRLLTLNNFLGLFLILLIPCLEEIGWRGYGVDSIRQNVNLFKTSLIFAFLWSLWHLPLFFIKYWNTNIIYIVNFFITLLPLSIIINWIYYKNNQSIIAAIILHFYVDLIEVTLRNEYFISSIFTLLLVAVAILIVLRNKKFFFE